ncbi:MAG TPA: ATP-binding protein [Bryobacteraceae bacterium]|nr:ATP-binding protein [Bryobacteraceae bacterium]
MGYSSAFFAVLFRGFFGARFAAHRARCASTTWHEVGYVPFADIGAEFLFRVISERAERAALIATTNLPFSEWTAVFPNPRLCKVL